MRKAPAAAPDPNGCQELYKRALILGFEGDFDASLGALRELVAAFPDQLEARFQLAMSQMMQGQYEEACANLRHVLEIDPTYEKAVEQARFC